MTRTKGLTATALKTIAIAAMTADHVAWLLFPGYDRHALPLILHLIGRLTCPVMCFFVAEGYHYTHDVKKYTRRLGGFCGRVVLPALFPGKRAEPDRGGLVPGGRPDYAAH